MKKSPQNFTETIVSTVKWRPKHSSVSDSLLPGEIAGFGNFFQNSPEHLASMYIGITGNHRYKAISWLKKQSEILGLEQQVIEFRLRLKNSNIERINGLDNASIPTREYDLTKATTDLKIQMANAWAKAVMYCGGLDIKTKTNLLTAAMSDNVNDFITISSDLFSKSIELMHSEFQNADAIFFPATPIDLDAWKDNPATLIAFSKEVIIDYKGSDASDRVRH